jgi:hypothetical protein
MYNRESEIVNDNSEIIVSEYATTYMGNDAVMLVRAAHLYAALQLYAKSKIRTARNISPLQLLMWAEQLTSKKYKGSNKYFEAAEDVRVWVQTMKAALPVTLEGDRK